MSLLNIYWRAIRYLGPESRQVVIVCTANIILAIITIAEPILLGRVIDAIAGKSDIFPALSVWAGFGLFNILAFVLVSRQADRLAHSRRLAVLTDSYQRVISMPLAWHQQRGTSRTLHTLLRAVESMFGLWLEFLRQHLSTAVALVLLIPTAMVLDLRLSMVLIILGILYVMIGRLVMNKTKDGQVAVEGHHHKVFAHVSDSISNISVLQSYNRVEEETRALREYTASLYAAQHPVLDWWALASGLHRMASTISMVVVLLLGSFLVMRGELRVGEIIAFTGFASLLISRLDQVSAFVNQIVSERAKLEEFYELEDSAEYQQEVPGVEDLDHVVGDVTFDGVTFQFPNSGQGVCDISFNAKAGQTIAIVGPTGSGKTTLINLLQRVYTPIKGRILVDGIDTESVTRRSLRNSIATVFQDAAMFNRSIEDNIRIGRSDADKVDVHAAAEAAAAHEFILAKSHGYDTTAGERGSQLSGGERQRIAIARAILKDAPILVLDEATSALDVETEERVRVAVDRLCQNRTTFIIAHRLSTVRNADLVLFLDNGRIVEQGSFAELSAKNGRFASLLRVGGLLTEEPAPVTSNVAEFPVKHEAA
ncbi:MAG: glucan ABC transporter ATP-binding protein/ permease [Phyllobacterium sp.]